MNIPLKTFTAFDAGKNARRLRGVTVTNQAINAQIRAYGANVRARSRYLAANNTYAAAAKETFISALVGAGIVPSPMQEPTLKAALIEAWLEWTDEADADGLTDLYGLQALIAAEMFEAGECFVRFRPRRPTDGFSIPLQIQVLPSEMLDISYNDDGKNITCGIEFDAIGRRTTYHFWKYHPTEGKGNSEKTPVPASEVLHLYRPIRMGQVRGVPHTISSIVRLAILDQYDDAELERKRSAALFAAFVRRPIIDTGEHPLQMPTTSTTGATEEGLTQPTSTWSLEPGAVVDLEPGEEIQFSQPADVGNSYEQFQYRNLLAIAAGMGVPYSAMTGDLRQTSYGSLRGGLVEFRRRIEALQHSVMVYQFCRPVWRRWLQEAVLAQAVPINPAAFADPIQQRLLRKVKWIPPKWEWIDPLKDLQAEKLAVDNLFKSRSDVIEAIGDDRESTDARIAADNESAKAAGIETAEQALKPEPGEFAPENDGDEDANADE